MTVFFVVIILVLVALSAHFFVPYFFLSSRTNVGRTQRFVVVFLLVFFYAMLFLTYGDYMQKLYDKVQGIPFLPNATAVHALYNMARFGVLYTVLCLPMDLYRVGRNVVLGRYSIGRIGMGAVVLLIFAFVMLYGGQLVDGTLKLNRSLVVLRRDEVYLNRQTNLGWYNDITPWQLDMPDEMRSRSESEGVVRRGRIDPLMPAGDNAAGGASGTLKSVLEGEVSVEEALERTGRYLKEDVYVPVRDWLVRPFDESEE